MNREKEFITIIENNKALIYKVAGFYTNQPQDRENLFQEIIYQLWKSVDSFRQQSSVSTWIYRVAMNTAIHFLRKRKQWVTKDLRRHYDRSMKQAEALLADLDRRLGGDILPVNRNISLVVRGGER